MVRTEDSISSCTIEVVDPFSCPICMYLPNIPIKAAWQDLALPTKSGVVNLCKHLLAFIGYLFPIHFIRSVFLFQG